MKKWYEKVWVITLFSIFFPLVGIVLILINKHMQKKTKIILSAVVGIWLLFTGISAFNDASKIKMTEVSKEENTLVVKDKKIEVINKKEAAKKVEEIKKIGRCRADLKASMPSYLNDDGYVVIDQFDSSSEVLLENVDNWKIQQIEQTGPEKFKKIDKYVPHKTKVKVIEETLSHVSHGSCRGWLKVKSYDNNEVFFIDVNNFVTISYWNLDPLNSLSYGNSIAEYINEEISPLNHNGEWYKIPKGTKILLSSSSSSDKIEGFILDKNKELQSLIFDPKSLKIIY